MRVMSLKCYKLKIRKVIIRKKREKPTLTYQSLAQEIGVEPSYLSRFLGDTDVHFSEELLFRLLTVLKIGWSEIDMILLLKEYDRSPSLERKKFLIARLRLGRVQRWKKILKEMKDELGEVAQVLE